MAADTVISMLENPTQSNVCPKIPAGLKENIFVVNNQVNIERRGCGEQSQFFDDCGAWTGVNGGASPATRFIKISAGKYKTVVYRYGKYNKEARLDKKKILVELEPQPDPSSVIELHRHYATLKSDANYKRRISWISNPTNHAKFEAICVVEYIGVYPGSQAHGNSKMAQAPYIRTSATGMNAIAQRAKNEKPGKLFEDLMLTQGEEDLPRDTKQIRNKKYNDKVKDNANNTYKQNFADNVQNVDIPSIGTSICSGHCKWKK